MTLPDDQVLEMLRDDYTKRAADVLRAIESKEAAIRAAASSRSGARTS